VTRVTQSISNRVNRTMRTKFVAPHANVVGSKGLLGREVVANRGERAIKSLTESEGSRRACVGIRPP